MHNPESGVQRVSFEKLDEWRKLEYGMFIHFGMSTFSPKDYRGSGKAIIATARKFLGIIYNTLKNGWVFEDFPNFVIANS